MITASSLADVLAVGGLGAWASALSLTLVGTAVALRKLARGPARLDAPFALFPVSILKPLKGVDPGLEQNLESFFRLDYPNFELLFSVADRRDPALAVVERVLARHPAVPARVLIGSGRSVPVGPNPKISNLMEAYALARNDLLLISDSNIRVEPDYLRRQVAELDPGVGVVTAVVVGREARGIGGALEATFLNTFYARWIYLTETLGRPCVLGKSMLFRRSDAERFGGFRTLSRYLAEDFMAGEAMRRLGRRVVVSASPITQIVGARTSREFWSRHLRWGRIRKSQAVLAFAAEPLGGALLSGVLGTIGFHRLLGTPSAGFMACHLLVWATCDFLLMRRLGGEAALRSPLGWILREISALPLWFHISLGSEIEWRGQRMKLLPGGLLEARDTPVGPAPFAAPARRES